MARALVIGGSLLIGRTLVEQLLERGDDVVIMHRGVGTPFGTSVGEIQCDRNDTEKVDALLRAEHFDLVFDNVFDWQRGTTAEQVLVTARATRHGNSLQRYVFTSSVAAFAPGGPYDEESTLVPSNFPNSYGAQKAESERALFALHRAEGFPVTTIRPTFIFGAHNPFDRESFFWDRIVAGRPVILPGDGSTPIQFVYSRDVARAAIRTTECDVAVGRGYNLVNFPPITQREFVSLLARVAGREARFVEVPRETIKALKGNAMAPPLYFGAYLDVAPITVRNNRLATDLGFAMTPMEDALRETFEWYRQQVRPAPDVSWEDRAIAAVG